MTIAEFDHLDKEKIRESLQQCCGSTAWVNKMLTIFPVEDFVELLDFAEEKWGECNMEDWKEAFEHHPKIGDTNSFKENFESTKQWAAQEQSGVEQNSANNLKELASANAAYQQKFGFIFIVCATGKSGDEMLHLLKTRINNNEEDEIKNAAAEQLKITKLRLEKLFT